MKFESLLAPHRQLTRDASRSS